ncbi:hypothetical protein CBL_12346 [Carabus blaptoides fortunei]
MGVVNDFFGGVSVLLVSDLNKLPPVMDSPIYKFSFHSEIKPFCDTNPLWDHFKFYELQEIMRQKNEKLFVEALNNLAIGQISKENEQLIKSETAAEEDVSESAIRLFADHKNVDLYNHIKIDSHPETEFISEAKDIILGKVNDATRTQVLNSLKNKKVSEVNGLPYRIIFKIGIKYMAYGTLRYISFEPNSNNPTKIWLDFQSKNISNKAKLNLMEFVKSENIDKSLTPLSKSNVPFNVSKKLQLFNFKIQNFYVITDYKSSACSNALLEKNIDKMMLKDLSNTIETIVLGDFNIDVKCNTEIDTNESNKYHNFEDLQRACNFIGLLYTNPGTNGAHYFAVLPKYQQFSLLRHEYRGDRRAHIGDELAPDS